MKTSGRIASHAFTLSLSDGSVQPFNNSRLLTTILTVKSADTLDGTLRFYLA